MNEKKEHIYLVDGSTYIFRAYHALPPLTRKSDGFPVGAISGFCSMLDKLVKEEREQNALTHLLVVFDASGKTFRNDIYPEYKANRSEPPEDLIPQFPVIRSATDAFNIKYVEMLGYEADDLIASYAKSAHAENMKVTIVSSDKDLMQLINDDISMLDTMKNRIINKEGVYKKFGVYPEKVIDVQSLAGDSVDNVPGVPGIGVKTAALLINEYGNLDNLFKKTDEITQKKRRENLKDFADQAYLSKKLVTLKDDIDLPIPLKDTKIKEINPEKLLGFLREMEFKRLAEKKSSELNVDIDSILPTKTIKFSTNKDATKKDKVEKIEKLDFNTKNYKTIQNKLELMEWYKKAEEVGYIAFDTETDSLNAIDANLIGFSMCIRPGEACYVPLKHIETDEKQLDFEESLIFLKLLLEDEGIIKILHNMKYDGLVLSKYKIDIKNYDDTMLISYSLGSGGIRHSLDNLVKTYFSHTAISYKEIVGTGKKKKIFSEISISDATEYAAEDADMTMRLWKFLKPKLSQNNLMKVYIDIERPLARTLIEMEKEGVAIDKNKLKRLSKNFEEKIVEIEKVSHELIGEEFNLGSPKQIGEILYEKLSIPGGKKTASGAWSTDANVLEALVSEGHELPKLLLQWRGLSKLKTTYTDALPTFISKSTNRVHTSFAMATTSTGRLASSDPNLQNIPIRTEDGRMIRKAFIPEKGNLLISADYSQIELRLIAHIAQDKNLKEAFKDGQDIHSLTASEVFNIPINDVDENIRRSAKAINFGIIYGISAFGLAKQLNISRTEASEYIRSYFAKFSSIKEYMSETKEFAKKNGYVNTIFGRKCIISDIDTKNPARRSFMERAAINAPIQGSAADIIKRAMIRMHDELRNSELKTKMLLQVHDELIFESDEMETDDSIRIIKKVMENAHKPSQELSVPLIVELRSGLNWNEAH
ncbi:MAG: DNA polymerase I [Rhodobiaceae bacterium]|nr:DNA polymerase I [Rhodobiaceae bacterium]